MKGGQNKLTAYVLSMILLSPDPSPFPISKDGNYVHTYLR
jgi:hypothetical protein